jgi:hypothetical protein
LLQSIDYSSTEDNPSYDQQIETAPSDASLSTEMDNNGRSKQPPKEIPVRKPVDNDGQDQDHPSET